MGAEGNGIYAVGITEHAQALLGDMVFVDLPEVVSTVDIGSECAVVESVKAASDIYVPLSGEVVEVNSELVDSPELINEQPYQEGWIFRIKISEESELNDLLDADAYSALVAEEE